MTILIVYINKVIYAKQLQNTFWKGMKIFEILSWHPTYQISRDTINILGSKHNSPAWIVCRDSIRQLTSVQERKNIYTLFLFLNDQISVCFKGSEYKRRQKEKRHEMSLGNFGK